MPKAAYFERFSVGSSVRHARETSELVAANKDWLTQTPYSIDTEDFSSMPKAWANIIRLTLDRSQVVGILYDAEGRQPNGDYDPVRFPIGIGAVTFGQEAVHPATGRSENCALVDYWLMRRQGAPGIHISAARSLARVARTNLHQGRRVIAAIGTIEEGGEHQPLGVAYTFQEIGVPEPRAQLRPEPTGRYEPYQNGAAMAQLYMASDITGIELGHLV